MIMETIKPDTVHNSGSICPTISCINVQDEELSKEKEEELLYGADEDGDEEEALSDDSLRLRFSDDDEAELEVFTQASIDQVDKTMHENNESRSIVTTKEQPHLDQEHVMKKDSLSTEENKAENDLSAVNNEERHGISNLNVCSDENSNSDIKNMVHNSVGNEITTVPDIIEKVTKFVTENTEDASVDVKRNSSKQKCKDNSMENDNESSKVVAYNNIKNNVYNNIQEHSNVISEENSNMFEKLNESYDITNKMKTNSTHNIVYNDCDFNSVDNFEDTEISLDTDVQDSIDEKEINYSRLQDNEGKSEQINQATLKYNQDSETNKINVEDKQEMEVNNEFKTSQKNTDISDNEEIQQDYNVKDNLKFDHDEHNYQSTDCVENSPAVITNNLTKQLTSDEISTIKETSKESPVTRNNVLDISDINDIISTVKNVQFPNGNADKVEVLSIQNITLKPTTNTHSNKRSLNTTDGSTSPVKTSKFDTSDDDNFPEDTQPKTENEKPLIVAENSNFSTINCADKLDLNRGDNLMPVENNLSNINLKIENKNQDINIDKSDIKVSTDKYPSSAPAVVEDTLNDNEKEINDVPLAFQRRRRRTRKMVAAAREAAEENRQGRREEVRQKRKTAKNAAEMIRKEFLNRDSDLESSDSSEKFVSVNHKISQNARPLSPPSLKRDYPDSDTTVINGIVKRIKPSIEEVPTQQCDKRNIKDLHFIQKFFQRDIKEQLPKLKQEELEELLIQKIVETIAMRGEIGRLREQARISERNQEATRARCQQLAKQMKDFEMVLSRNAAERRANNDKPTPPIKINRSVGLQVNFMLDHGMQNLRQLQQNSSIKPANIPNNVNLPTSELNSNTISPRRGIKVRSPRRSEAPSATQVTTTTTTQSQIHTPSVTSTVTPAALVVTKPLDSQHALSLSNQANNFSQMLPNQQQQSTIVLNGKMQNQINRQGTTLTISKTNTNDLIDLTDEEEKNKSVTNAINESSMNIPPKAQLCFQRVIQALPGNVAITSQPTSIRVVQSSSHPTPTAIVNNMSAPRLAYVMQGGIGSTRQLLITSNSNQIRPVTTCNRAPFPAVTYKTGISTIANGTVRVLTTSAVPNVQLNKHPASLPDTPNYASNPMWKLPPPAPSLKISKVANGIVLSWNMALSDKYADIASYQLYAYQEVAGVPPSTALWKKVGDVRALPLPMACTLTQKETIITLQSGQLIHIPEKGSTVYPAISLCKT